MPQRPSGRRGCASELFWTSWTSKKCLSQQIVQSLISCPLSPSLSSKRIRLAQHRQAMYVWRNVEAGFGNSCRGKAINITYSKRVFFALVIVHATRMRHIILSSVACPVLQYFFYLWDINSTIFGKMLLNVKRVIIFSSSFVENISRFKKNSERYYHKCENVWM